MSRFRTPVTSDDHIEGPLAAPPPPRSPYPPSLAGTAVRRQTPEVGARMRASRKLRFCAGAGAVMGVPTATKRGQGEPPSKSAPRGASQL